MYCQPSYKVQSIATPKLSAQAALDLCWHLLILFGCAIGIEMLMPGYAQAGLTVVSNPILPGMATTGSANLYSDFSYIIYLLTGTTGRAIATIAILSLGFSAAAGKLSKERAMLVAAGIATIFGAASIVQIMGGNATNPITPGSTDSIGYAFGAIVALVTGPTGMALATIAVVALGIGAMFGKITYPQAMAAAVGIAIMFGAANLVRTLGGTAVTLSAKTTNPLEIGLYSLVNFVTGSAGISLATLAVIALGIGAMFGKITYPQALLVVVGIVLVFGASNIVKSLALVSQSTSGYASDSSLPNGVFNNSILYAFTNILYYITSPVGTALATVAVIILGIGAFFGKITYPQALIVATGIGIIFGSASIISKLTSSPITQNTSGEAVVGNFLDGVLAMLTGPAATALATLAVTALGVGALFGKVSYPTALIFVVGITLVFGAFNIVTTMLVSSSNTGSTPCGLNLAKGCNDAVAFGFGKIINYMLGGVGATLGSIAVITVGIGAMFGKISYSTALVTVTGIAILFGSAAFVNAFLLLPMNVAGQFVGYSNTLGSTPNTVGYIFSNVITKIAMSTAGQFVGIIAVMIIGIGAFFGKISWPTALLVVIGIALVYGSQALVYELSPANGGDIAASAANCVIGFSTPLNSFARGLQSPTVKALASMAVIMLGLGAMVGKISYPAALVLVTGIGLTFGADTIVTLLAGNASAVGPSTNAGAIETALCNIANLLTGGTARALADLGVIMLGIGAMLGKVSFHLAITIMVGIGVMFGANDIVVNILHFGAGCTGAPPTVPQPIC